MPTPIISTVWYQIVNVNSNRSLEVAENPMLDQRLRDGVLIQQGDPVNVTDSSPWPLWQIVEVENGVYNFFNKGSGRCMVIQNGGVDNGNPCCQNSVSLQRLLEQWRITGIANSGAFYIQNVNSSRYIEIEDSGTEKGDRCQQWDITTPNRPGAQWLLMQTEFTTVPQLTKAHLSENKIHNSGMSRGSVRGENLSIGSTILVVKGNKIKTWEGVIDNNHSDDNLSIYWTFNVDKKSGGADPSEDDTITVTVTNPAQQPSTPALPADPQPADVP
jgi:hypothetical protein